MSSPYVSLCLICGDKGVEVFPRLLRSVLVRPDGRPLVDEIVVGWNGSVHGSLSAAIDTAGGGEATFPILPPDWTWEVGEEIQYTVYDVPLRVFRQTWVGDFAKARQETFERAAGVWRGYLDTDDVVPNPDDPADRAAIDRCLEAYGVGRDVAGTGRGQSLEAPKGLSEYLRALPPGANCLVLPYDYTIGGDGVALERHPRRRFVRWADGWVWKPSEYYHEDLAPTGCVEYVVTNAGLPIRHYPNEPVEQRTARNRSILRRMVSEVEKGARLAEPRLYYNLATYAMQEGDAGRAVALLTDALKIPHSDRVLYLFFRAKMYLALGDRERAAGDAMSIVDMAPDRSLGFFLLEEAAHAGGSWEATLLWHQLGRNKKNWPELIDHPVEREAHTRCLAAEAALQLRKWEEARRWADEAIEAHPSDAISQDCWAKVQRTTGWEQEMGRALATVGRYLAVGDGPRARAAVETFPPGCGSDPRFLGAREAVQQFFATAANVIASPLPSPLPPAPWVRWIGSWALGTGASSVALVGRVEEEDLKALRDAVPEIEWVLANAEPDRTFDVVVDVDVCHTAAPLTVPGRLANVSVFPTPEVPDPARCRATDIEEVAELELALPNSLLTDLRTVGSKRPGSGPSRIVRVRRRGARPERELTIAAPHWLEPWGPDSVVEEGCGGSEEAIIYLSAALARRGVGVTVYGPYRPEGGVEVRDGVTWRPWETFRVDAVRGPLVAHRAPELLRDPGIRKLVDGVWCWHHDHAYSEPTRWPEMSNEARGHLLVSKWQLGSLEDDAGHGLKNTVVIGNGVPREDYLGGAASLPHDPKRVIYLSQPQRGLLGLLGMWPRILEFEPEATLYLYYGWATAEMLARTVATDTGEVLTRIGEILRTAQRVKTLRRVPQKRLAQEMRQAGVWAYPTEYPEVSCIAGMRAGAAGCALVYRKTAALPETMADDRYAVGSEEFTEELFVSRVVTAMRDDQYPRDEIASAVLERDSWDAVAGRLVAGMWRG